MLKNLVSRIEVQGIAAIGLALGIAAGTASGLLDSATPLFVWWIPVASGVIAFFL